MSVADLSHIISLLLPEPHAGLLSGILFGTKATLSPDFKEALITTGTIHIVALSGMNITIIASLAIRTLLYRFSRRVASLLTVLIIIGFVAFVGVSASVVRAALMGSLALFGVLFGRQVWPIWGLIISVVIMLLVRPDWITDVGFQLSVLATLGILLFGGSTEKNKGKPKSKADTVYSSSASEKFSLRSNNIGQLDIALQGPTLDMNHQVRTLKQIINTVFSFLWHLVEDDLRITLSAQVFTLPLILFTFHRVSLISPLANILIGWLIAPLTVAGMIMIVAFWLLPPLGVVISWGVWIWLGYLIWVVETVSKLPFAALGW